MADFTNAQYDKMFETGGGKRAVPRPAPAIAIFKFGILITKLKSRNV